MIIKDIHIVGTTFNSEGIVAAAAQSVRMGGNADVMFTAVPRPDNAVDENAIEIQYCGQPLGFVNANAAKGITRIAHRVVAKNGYATPKVENVRAFTNKGNTGFWMDLSIN